MFQGIPGVSIYIDDILVTRKTNKEHLKNLDEVLSRLEQSGLRLKRSKCAFMLPSTEYLGHKISAEGLQPTQEKYRKQHILYYYVSNQIDGDHSLDL